MTDNRKELRRETADPTYPDYPPELSEAMRIVMLSRFLKLLELPE